MNIGDAKSRRLIWYGLLVVVSAAVTWACVFAMCMRYMPQTNDRPAWTSDSGQPPPDNWFRIVMFPASASVPLFDAPDGTEVMKLSRAVANTPSEVRTGGWIGVNENGQMLWVRFQDLALLPVPGTEHAYMDAMSSSLKVRTGDQYASAQFNSVPAPLGSRVTVRIKSEKAYQESTYLVRGTAVQPESLLLVGEAGAGIKAFVRAFEVLLAAVGASIAALVVGFGLRAVLKRQYLKRLAQEP